MSKKLRCGLIGMPLGHSYSPEIHALLGDYDYTLTELREEEVGEYIRSDRYDATNVTIPYKKTVMQFLDVISDEALRIGSVNTVTHLPDGRLRGDNTDYFGFAYMLDCAGIDVKDKIVVVIGDGGASMTARTVAADRGAKEIRILTEEGNTPENLPKYSDAEILINTSPVGMYPKNGRSPVPMDNFPHLCGVVDVVYNPSKTAIILDAEERGIPCISGLTMLVAQAKVASELFTGTKISDDVLATVTRKVQLAKKNITLVGMPGSGKSTIGRALAALMGREFIDLDDYITEKAGMPIPEIFAQHGEPYFRDLETQCLEEVSKLSGMVLSMGGGTPVRPGNRRMIRQNSTVVFLKRDLALLPKDGRPVSQANDLAKLYEVRRPFYEEVSEYEIDVQPSAQENAKHILEVIGL
ncbi:MAG: shikimate kinase [Clostridia bacterium]|nr:shikimate kinase [Clostridia bacterium]